MWNARLYTANLTSDWLTILWHWVTYMQRVLALLDFHWNHCLHEQHRMNRPNVLSPFKHATPCPGRASNYCSFGIDILQFQGLWMQKKDVCIFPNCNLQVKVSLRQLHTTAVVFVYKHNQVYGCQPMWNEAKHHSICNMLLQVTKNFTKHPFLTWPLCWSCNTAATLLVINCSTDGKLYPSSFIASMNLIMAPRSATYRRQHQMRWACRLTA